MYNVVKNLETGYISISDTFDILADIGLPDSTPYLNNSGDEYILSFINIENVKKFTKFNYYALGINDIKYLSTYYRISRDNTKWSDWLVLSNEINNFPLVDVKDPIYIDIKWIRGGSSNVGSIRILEYKLEGELDRQEEYLGFEGESITVRSGEYKIASVPFIFKVFKITDFSIISSSDLSNVEIKYRYSQDSTKTWSEWELLTKENITTTKINPIRFFQIEYKIDNKSSSNINIKDINIIGDFQNVSSDYQKINLFGIRECCPSQQNGYYDSSGNFIPNLSLNSTGSGPNCDNNYQSMTDEQKAQLYNPYKQSEAFKLLEKLSADSEQISGHRVTYFVTDPDKKGQDHSLNEYQLFNISCYNDLKVSINGNEFPDSQIKINVFDLDLFQTMEAHITKKQFKEVFGVQRRPSKEDFLYFCDINRMFQVEHAQQFRSFNNSAVYYKLILKKYTQKANVIADNVEVKNVLNNLVKNSTIDELFGDELAKDKASIANKDQTMTLTKDPIRLEYKAQIDKELIENGSNIISKSNYDLNSVDVGTTAVEYKNLRSVLKKSDNLSFIAWFNINNYLSNDIYNFIDFYDSENSLGYKINLTNDDFIINLNSDEYRFNISEYTGNDPIGLEEEVWYCYLININQRQNFIEQYIYKRNIDDEDYGARLTTTTLRKIYYYKKDINPIEFIKDDINPKILGSDMKITNIRLFNDVLPEDSHNKILNQYIIGDDSKYLIFADNATTRLYLPNFYLNE